MKPGIFDEARSLISHIEREHRRDTDELQKQVHMVAGAAAETLRENNELDRRIEAAEVVIARLTDGTQAEARRLIDEELAEMGVAV